MEIKIFKVLIILGICVSVVFLTLLVEWFLDDDRHDKGQHDDDSDDSIDNLGTDSKCRGVVRHTEEEMIQVLQVMRLGACNYEREVLNEIIDMLTEREGNPNGN